MTLPSSLCPSLSPPLQFLEPPSSPRIAVPPRPCLLGGRQVAPQSGHRGALPRGQAAPSRGPRGHRPPPSPRPVLLVDFTSAPGFCRPSPPSSAYGSPVAPAPVVVSPDDARSPGPIPETAGGRGTFQGEQPPTPGLVSLSEPFYPGKPVSRLLRDALNE